MNKQIRMVFLDAATVGAPDNLAEISSLGDYISYETTRPEERVTRIRGHNVVITNKAVIDREIIDACPELELVCITATGMNNVDLDYASQKGISVKNVAGYSTESVTQCTFVMLFYLMNASRYYDDYVKSGQYAKSEIFTHLGREFTQLSGTRFGVIGMGAIGKRVAAVASAFGAQVYYNSTSGKNLNVEGYPHLPLEELLASSDVVSIHCPLNDRTHNLLSGTRLRLMKPTAYLINMGRGGIVDEAALAGAINENMIAGAALDVLEAEPMAASNPLLSVGRPEKLFITPHIAWASREARRLLITGTAQNIKKHFRI